MTREEAIKVLKDLWRYEHSKFPEKYIREALDMAIKALEQEPCGDAISRQAVLEYIEGSCAELGHSSENELVCKDIKEFSSVIPLEQEPVLDKIRAEIEKQEKWLLQAGYNIYNVDIAFDTIKHLMEESEDKT